jgi:hypothetical protein
MATIGRRAATWTNSDGLVVGFGPHNAPTAGGMVNSSGAVKQTKTYFDWRDLNAARAIYADVPKGARVLDVRINVITGFTSTGTNTITVGDGGDADGFITTTAADTTTMASDGAVILPDGVYSYDDTGDGDATAAELKSYSAADTIDLASGQTDWTAGVATLEVSYIGKEV